MLAVDKAVPSSPTGNDMGLEAKEKNSLSPYYEVARSLGKYKNTGNLHQGKNFKTFSAKPNAYRNFSLSKIGVNRLGLPKKESRLSREGCYISIKEGIKKRRGQTVRIPSRYYGTYKRVPIRHDSLSKVKGIPKDKYDYIKDFVAKLLPTFSPERRDAPNLSENLSPNHKGIRKEGNGFKAIKGTPCSLGNQTYFKRDLKGEGVQVALTPESENPIISLKELSGPFKRAPKHLGQKQSIPSPSPNEIYYLKGAQGICSSLKSEITYQYYLKSPNIGKLESKIKISKKYENVKLSPAPLPDIEGAKNSHSSSPYRKSEIKSLTSEYYLSDQPFIDGEKPVGILERGSIGQYFDHITTIPRNKTKEDFERDRSPRIASEVSHLETSKNFYGINEKDMPCESYNRYRPEEVYLKEISKQNSISKKSNIYKPKKEQSSDVDQNSLYSKVGPGTTVTKGQKYSAQENETRNKMQSNENAKFSVNARRSFTVLNGEKSPTGIMESVYRVDDALPSKQDNPYNFMKEIPPTFRDLPYTLSTESVEIFRSKNVGKLFLGDVATEVEAKNDLISGLNYLAAITKGKRMAKRPKVSSFLAFLKGTKGRKVDERKENGKGKQIYPPPRSLSDSHLLRHVSERTQLKSIESKPHRSVSFDDEIVSEKERDAQGDDENKVASTEPDAEKISKLFLKLRRGDNTFARFGLEPKNVILQCFLSPKFFYSNESDGNKSALARFIARHSTQYEAQASLLFNFGKDKPTPSGEIPFRLVSCSRDLVNEMNYLSCNCDLEGCMPKESNKASDPSALKVFTCKAAHAPSKIPGRHSSNQSGLLGRLHLNVRPARRDAPQIRREANCYHFNEESKLPLPICASTKFEAIVKRNSKDEISINIAPHSKSSSTLKLFCRCRSSDKELSESSNCTDTLNAQYHIKLNTSGSHAHLLPLGPFEKINRCEHHPQGRKGGFREAKKQIHPLSGGSCHGVDSSTSSNLYVNSPIVFHSASRAPSDYNRRPVQLRSPFNNNAPSRRNRLAANFNFFRSSAFTPKTSHLHDTCREDRSKDSLFKQPAKIKTHLEPPNKVPTPQSVTNVYRKQSTQAEGLLRFFEEAAIQTSETSIKRKDGEPGSLTLKGFASKNSQYSFPKPKEDREEANAAIYNFMHNDSSPNPSEVAFDAAKFFSQNTAGSPNFIEDRPLILHQNESVASRLRLLRRGHLPKIKNITVYDLIHGNYDTKTEVVTIQSQSTFGSCKINEDQIEANETKFSNESSYSAAGFVYKPVEKNHKSDGPAYFVNKDFCANPSSKPYPARDNDKRLFTSPSLPKMSTLPSHFVTPFSQRDMKSVDLVNKFPHHEVHKGPSRFLNLRNSGKELCRFLTQKPLGGSNEEKGPLFALLSTNQANIRPFLGNERFSAGIHLERTEPSFKTRTMRMKSSSSILPNNKLFDSSFILVRKSNSIASKSNLESYYRKIAVTNMRVPYCDANSYTSPVPLPPSNKIRKSASPLDPAYAQHSVENQPYSSRYEDDKGAESPRDFVHSGKARLAKGVEIYSRDFGSRRQFNEFQPGGNRPGHSPGMSPKYLTSPSMTIKRYNSNTGSPSQNAHANKKISPPSESRHYADTNQIETFEVDDINCTLPARLVSSIRNLATILNNFESDDETNDEITSPAKSLAAILKHFESDTTISETNLRTVKSLTTIVNHFQSEEVMKETNDSRNKNEEKGKTSGALLGDNASLATRANYTNAFNEKVRTKGENANYQNPLRKKTNYLNLKKSSSTSALPDGRKTQALLGGITNFTLAQSSKEDEEPLKYSSETYPSGRKPKHSPHSRKLSPTKTNNSFNALLAFKDFLSNLAKSSPRTKASDSEMSSMLSLSIANSDPGKTTKTSKLEDQDYHNRRMHGPAKFEGSSKILERSDTRLAMTSRSKFEDAAFSYDDSLAECTELAQSGYYRENKYDENPHKEKLGYKYGTHFYKHRPGYGKLEKSKKCDSADQFKDYCEHAQLKEYCERAKSVVLLVDHKRGHDKIRKKSRRERSEGYRARQVNKAMKRLQRKEDRYDAVPKAYFAKGRHRRTERTDLYQNKGAARLPRLTYQEKFEECHYDVMPTAICEEVSKPDLEPCENIDLSAYDARESKADASMQVRFCCTDNFNYAETEPNLLSDSQSRGKDLEPVCSVASSDQGKSTLMKALALCQPKPMLRQPPINITIKMDPKAMACYRSPRLMLPYTPRQFTAYGPCNGYGAQVSKRKIPVLPLNLPHLHQLASRQNAPSPPSVDHNARAFFKGPVLKRVVNSSSYRSEFFLPFGFSKFLPWKGRCRAQPGNCATFYVLK